MTGISILLFALAGVLLFAAVAAILAYERERVRDWWDPAEKSEPVAAPSRHRPKISVRTVAQSVESEAAEIKLGTGTTDAFTRPQLKSGEVFRYTLKRPASAVRKKMPDLGGYSEVPLRLYDQLGNRFTVHQKVRLN